ncbi:fms-related tyrosine kinase 3 ligand isoform X2 [Carettochelys insculpta]|uniref:fms-related tyrosine kinase 3 ligand isoform X2 n=1 Tax=Carettochelys insculpta TaxID=44489 RepID=UPI003EC10899
MTWRYAPPNDPPRRRAAVVPLLLLLPLTLLPPSHSCTFQHDPVTTAFDVHIGELSQHLLRDYPVVMPGNLDSDGQCAELWALHFLALELERMVGVAGPALQPLVAKVAKQVGFLQECAIRDPAGCVRLERANVSQLLADLSAHLVALQSKTSLAKEQQPVSFSNCSHVRCQPGPPELPLVPLLRMPEVRQPALGMQGPDAAFPHSLAWAKQQMEPAAPPNRLRG